MSKTDSESKVAATSTIMEPERESKTAAVSTAYLLEEDLSTYAQRLTDFISSANDTCNNSVPDVLMS